MDSNEEVSYRRTFVVETTVERAFEEFTAGRGGWWPRDHNLGRLPVVGIEFEPRVGGTWFERDSAGDTIHRGHVLVWDPPHRVVVDWPLFFSEVGPDAPLSEMELRFHPHLPGVIRIELEHRGMHHTDDPTFVKQKFFSRYGWDMVTRNYAGYLASEPWGPELEKRRSDVEPGMPEPVQ